MKPLAVVLLLLAVLHAGLACFLPLWGQAAAAGLQKEVFGKLGMLGDAFDVPLAVQRIKEAGGPELEPHPMVLAAWLTEERGRGTVAAHNNASVVMGVSCVAIATCALALITLTRRRKAAATQASSA